MVMNTQQKKIKIEPKLNLNHNIYILRSNIYILRIKIFRTITREYQ